MVRSPFLAATIPTTAVIAAALRWWQQGSGNIYTALDKRLYGPDPDLGWRALGDRPLWLGLDVVAVLGAVALAVVGSASHCGALAHQRFWCQLQPLPAGGAHPALWIFFPKVLLQRLPPAGSKGG